VSMHRLRSCIVLGLLLLAAGACGGDDDSITEPPPTTTVTATFPGVLTLNGARTHTFTVTAGGSITAQLTTMTMQDPDDKSPVVPVGLSLGTWNGSICQIVLDNGATNPGQVVLGQTTAIGDFCVRIYDATGTVVKPQSYVIDVFYQVSNQ
jgi:hypothetical protein